MQLIESNTVGIESAKRKTAEEMTKEEEEVVAAPPEPPHFVLIHGVGGGAWCWYKLRCLMESSGYKVSCLDLKAAGIDPSNANDILCFEDYNKPLLDFLASLPPHQQVILVGHSAGGLSVTDATYKFPQKISLAIYLAATMLRTGFTTEQDIKDGAPDVSNLGGMDNVFDVGYGLGQDGPPTSAVVKKTIQRKLIYQMSPLEVKRLRRCEFPLANAISNNHQNIH
ncbi:unnamed protein product [Cuscuta epithymum]|uniref:AB hydrolase-1 domain-containing protein n=1 Tax=Cuscuta epithymum TaxID=186058 RepID=A0AAV0D409_9ASTE|nr:unnamed protein product [Cuscuta epithymum]